MKRIPVLFTILAAATVAVGCKPKSDTVTTLPSPSESVSGQLDHARTNTVHAVAAARNYAYAQKMEFVTEMKADLAEMNRKVDDMAARVEASSGPAKEEAKMKLQALRDKMAALNKQLDQVVNANESTWENVKNSFRAGYSDTKEAFTQARQWLADKIAP